jgi:hypothetical protein
MNLHRYQTTVVVLFFLALFAVPVIWWMPGRFVEPFSLIEGRELTRFPGMDALNFQVFNTAAKRVLQGQPSEALALVKGHLEQRSFEQKVEAAARDQFPFRMNWIHRSKALERGLIQLAYLFLDDPAIPADAASGLVVLRDGSMIDAKPASFNANTISNLENRIENYRELMAEHPELNFYVYYIERLYTSPFHPLNPYFPEADEGRTFQYFEEHKPEGLEVGKFLLNNLEDRLKYFYRTDHHWNIRGAWKAYEDIYGMIAPHYPEIGPMLELNGFQGFPRLGFLGSWARATYFPIKPDQFEIADVDLPPLRIYNRHGTEIIDDASARYLAGDYDTTPYTNHYAVFGGIYDQFKFINESSPNRNLLVIGSSFSPPNIRLIASHFKNTYFVDLREYGNFSLQEFLVSHPVDDVLVIGDNNAIEDPSWIISP